MEDNKLYRYKFSDNIAVYSEAVIPKSITPNGRLSWKRKRPTPLYDESLARKLFCSHCKREFIGETSNGFAYHVNDDCGGTPEDLKFLDE